MTTFAVPTVPSRYEGEEAHFKGAAYVRCPQVSPYGTFSVGGWTREGSGRLVERGRKVQGPHAYAFGNATVIAAHPIEDSTPTITVELGDHLLIEGSVYLVGAAANRNLKLTLVLETNGCDVPCTCHDGSYSCTNPETGEFRREGCNCEA